MSGRNPPPIGHGLTIPTTLSSSLFTLIPGKKTPMSLKERIDNDLKEAMKAKDADRLGTLRLVRAEVLKREKEAVGTVIDDAAMLTLLDYMVKQRRDSIEQYTAGGRPDLAEGERKELEVLAVYLPAALTDAEIDAIIDQAMATTGITTAKDMGRLMGSVMKLLKDSGKSFDGKAVNGRVKARLGG